MRELSSSETGLIAGGWQGEEEPIRRLPPLVVRGAHADGGGWSGFLGPIVDWIPVIGDWFGDGESEQPTEVVVNLIDVIGPIRHLDTGSGATAYVHENTGGLLIDFGSDGTLDTYIAPGGSVHDITP